MRLIMQILLDPSLQTQMIGIEYIWTGNDEQNLFWARVEVYSSLYDAWHLCQTIGKLQIAGMYTQWISVTMPILNYSNVHKTVSSACLGLCEDVGMLEAFVLQNLIQRYDLHIERKGNCASMPSEVEIWDDHVTRQVHCVGNPLWHSSERSLKQKIRNLNWKLVMDKIVKEGRDRLKTLQSNFIDLSCETHDGLHLVSENPRLFYDLKTREMVKSFDWWDWYNRND